METKVQSRFVQVAEGRRIYVDHLKGNRPSEPCILYVPGFLSQRNSEKGNCLLEYCSKSGLEFIRYDPEGMGESKFECLTQWSKLEFRHWFEDCQAAMSVSQNKRFILVGSSMGGWISLLAYQKLSSQIVALILIAPAQNFIARKVAEGQVLIPDQAVASQVNLQEFAKKSEDLSVSLEPNSIPLHVPMIILHGMRDDIIPPGSSMDLMRSLNGRDIELTFVKDGDHRLNEYLSKNIKNIIEKMIQKTTEMPQIK
eukprot:TRINITY_DN5757_c0_g1_i1.p1 TRINITY_DN5757_c0_g1~~TRINITY_DN5757_c0_g1_i1.p1  ORF type:complete len:255 (-),score=27.89 TRINITY_DN5757_c0_g1_i1:51-815(-)